MCYLFGLSAVFNFILMMREHFSFIIYFEIVPGVIAAQLSNVNTNLFTGRDAIVLKLAEQEPAEPTVKVKLPNAVPS
jgi:hypothetical protein